MDSAIRADLVDASEQVPELAEELIAEIEAPIDEVPASLEGVDRVEVFVYDSGTDQAFTPGGREMSTALVELAGGHKLFADLDETWAEVGWEDVVARAPDVLLVLDYGPAVGDDSVDQKREFLATHPSPPPRRREGRPHRRRRAHR